MGQFSTSTLEKMEEGYNHATRAEAEMLLTLKGRTESVILPLRKNV
jgi:hypothetical protein